MRMAAGEPPAAEEMVPEGTDAGEPVVLMPVPEATDAADPSPAEAEPLRPEPKEKPPEPASSSTSRPVGASAPAPVGPSSAEAASPADDAMATETFGVKRGRELVATDIDDEERIRVGAVMHIKETLFV